MASISSRLSGLSQAIYLRICGTSAAETRRVRPARGCTISSRSRTATLTDTLFSSACPGLITNFSTFSASSTVCRCLKIARPQAVTGSGPIVRKGGRTSGRPGRARQTGRLARTAKRSCRASGGLCRPTTAGLTASVG